MSITILLLRSPRRQRIILFDRNNDFDEGSITLWTKRVSSSFFYLPFSLCISVSLFFLYYHYYYHRVVFVSSLILTVWSLGLLCKYRLKSLLLYTITNHAAVGQQSCKSYFTRNQPTAIGRLRRRHSRCCVRRGWIYF